MHCSQIRNAVLWQAMRMQNDLIYDVGLHSGKDTEFYLAKGFRVVAIEANPVLATRCKTKFASQIKEGRLHILQLAIGEQAGNCDFFVCDQHDDWSTIDRRDRLKKEKQDGVTFRTVTVRCASLDTVLLEFGVPYYLKIDIEGWPAPGLDDTQLSKSGLPLELHRAQITDRRVSAFRVVEALDIVKHVCLCFIARPVRFVAGALGLQRGEEALHRGVVPHVA